MAFKKGQSGNPGGRPKEDNDVKQLAREHSEEALQRLLTWMRSENPKASVAACQAVLDRAYGKPAQALIGGDENDPPLKIQQVKRVIVRAQS
jgi:hypothetical protein